MTVDDVFKALADPTHRQLLDRLYARDGLTLGVLYGRVELHVACLKQCGDVLVGGRGC